MIKIKSLGMLTPKQITMSAAAGVLAAIILIVVVLSNTTSGKVRLEATLNVANYTADDTNYESSISVSTDQVVKFQIWFHNMENAESDKVAKNLRVKINFPNKAGTTQTVTGTVSANNSNTINLSSSVNLEANHSALSFIPGSVAWRHNKGTNDQPNWVTESISDNIVTSPEGIELGDEKPCFNFESTVTFMARINTPSYKITNEGRVNGVQYWSKDVRAEVGNVIEWRMQFQNLGNTTLNDVIVLAETPENTTIVPGSIELFNSNIPNGNKYDSSAIQGRQVNITVGNFAPGSNAWIYYNSRIEDADKLACGENIITNHAYATPEDLSTVTDTATVTVDKQCD